MEIITVEIISAIGKQIEPHSSGMDSAQRRSFHSMLETVCNKQIEIVTLEHNMKKIEILEHLIQLCIENKVQNTVPDLASLLEKLIKLV